MKKISYSILLAQGATTIHIKGELNGGVCDEDFQNVSGGDRGLDWLNPWPIYFCADVLWPAR